MSNCYLLGAGFSYEISCNKLPLLVDLGKEIESVIDADLKQNYDYSPETLERFLTYLDLRKKSNASSSEAKTREKITTFLIERFGTKRFKESINPLGKDFVNNVLKKDDIVITTNYDCLLEHIMCNAGIWTPNGGYSEVVKNSLFTKQHTENIVLKNIIILKVHGSVNFLEYCALKDDGEKELSLSLISVKVEEETFPTLHANFGIVKNAIKDQYIIGPSYVKVVHPQILKLWTLAFKKVSNIEDLVIMGTSLREEYTFTWLLLSNIQCNRVIVVDPHCTTVFNKLSKIASFTMDSVKRIPFKNLKEFIDWKGIPGTRT